MEENPQCDVVGCRLEYLDGRFQPSGGFLPTPGSVVSWICGLDKVPILKDFFLPVHPKNPKFFDKDRKVGWVMGAFLLMKRQVFENTKGFDENFFMYMEEVEWCRRIQKSGYNICYTPSFSVTHLDKASALGDTKRLAKIFRLEILGIVYYLRKHYPKQVKWLTPVIRIGVILRYLTFTLLGNKLRQDAYRQTLKDL
jgi:GT2 family glycosyltransferase